MYSRLKLVCQIIGYVDDDAIILLNYRSILLCNVPFKDIKYEHCLLIQRKIQLFFSFFSTYRNSKY